MTRCCTIPCRLLEVHGEVDLGNFCGCHCSQLVQGRRVAFHKRMVLSKFPFPHVDTDRFMIEILPVDPKYGGCVVLHPEDESFFVTCRANSYVTLDRHDYLAWRY